MTYSDSVSLETHHCRNNCFSKTLQCHMLLDKHCSFSSKTFCNGTFQDAIVTFPLTPHPPMHTYREHSRTTTLLSTTLFYWKEIFTGIEQNDMKHNPKNVWKVTEATWKSLELVGGHLKCMLCNCIGRNTPYELLCMCDRGQFSGDWARRRLSMDPYKFKSSIWRKKPLIKWFSYQLHVNFFVYLMILQYHRL